jgi:hypothetical protein
LPEKEETQMDTWVWILLAVVVLAALVLAVVAASRKRRSEQLREGFGPEYDHVVEETGDRREAERELAERQKRHDELQIVPLSDAVRTRYSEEWRQVQARFVDEPEGAVREADALVQRVMSDRGYPVADDFERRAADVSVDHPDVVENFREGHRLAGERDTESLRQAMVHFRSLFAQLLEGGRDREEVMSDTTDTDRQAVEEESRPGTADLVREADEVESARATDATDDGSAREPLFETADRDRFGDRWTTIQAAFVDDPRDAVKEADALVAELMQRLAETFSSERSRLESQWDNDEDVSTEDLRIALQRYRSFFDRLLSA